MVGGAVGRAGLVECTGVEYREGPPGAAAPVGIGDSAGVRGAHLPVVFGSRGQSAQGSAEAVPGGYPGSATWSCVEAVFKGAGIAAPSPSQGRIGGLVGGAVGRADLVERTGNEITVKDHQWSCPRWHRWCPWYSWRAPASSI